MPLVGREAELAQLHQWLDKARNCMRQIVFVTGEPGIGKTALIDAFVAQIAAVPPSTAPPAAATLRTNGAEKLRDTRTGLSNVWLTRGQCIEQYGTGEPYMPVLEALGRLGRGSQGTQLKAILHKHAPTWLAQMPALLSAKELKMLQPRVLGATRERMLRELAESLEVFTGAGRVSDPPLLVLVLEDLHWSDASTLELLALLARRREPARLLVLCTYRPLEVLGDGHSLTNLVAELRAHERCIEVALAALNETEVAQYLDVRFAASVLPTRLAEVLHQRTGGNPLFLVSTVNDWVQRGVLGHSEGSWTLHGDLDAVATQIPDTIRQLVTRQRQGLPSAEQRILEAGSVAGLEFSAAAVAAALETAGAEVEEGCLGLAERQQFLRPAGMEEWPDGTLAARYSFLHALYQQLWHEWVSVQRRQQWHLRIGARKEAAYGERTREVAAELAVHFEHGRDYPRAIRYLQQAGEAALRRSANVEAISHLTKALNLLPTLPDTPERVHQELALQTTLGVPLQMTKGLTHPEVEHAYTRARALCRQVGETPELFRTLMGLMSFHFARGDLETTRGLAEQLMRLAQRTQAPAFLIQAHAALASTLLMLGEFASVRGHAEQAMALHDAREPSSAVTVAGDDLGMLCLSLSRAAQALWFLGYPAQSLTRIAEALSLARASSHLYIQVWTSLYAAFIHQWRRESSLTQVRAQEVMELAREQGFASALGEGRALAGWALAAQGQRAEGIAQMRQSLTTERAAGQGLEMYYLILLVDAYGHGGQVEDALRVVAEGFVVMNKTGQRLFEAEMYRLKGELSLKSRSLASGVKNPQSAICNLQLEAEACFHKAIEVARRQEAKSLELRATVSLSRLWQRQGKRQQARQMLAEIYGWFTEGFDTADLQEAEALLEELDH